MKSLGLMVMAVFFNGSAVTIEPFTDEIRPAVSAGEFVKIYDPSEPPVSWYINDHTIIKGPDGTWHLFGITHEEPLNPPDERNFAHATAPSLHGPWIKQPFALTYDPAYGETYLWAPHVILYDGIYYMFYAGGGSSSLETAINLATSTDLYNWTRYPGGTLFRDGFDGRDPMVLRVEDQWVMYYCGTIDPAGGQHAVLYRTSADLVHWSDRQIAFTDPYLPGTSGGPIESPFVVAWDGAYYLFTGPRYDYSDTDVLRSADPFNFDLGQLVGRIPAHAVEVVEDDADGSWWVTHAGWGQGGVYLAPLNWTAFFSGARIAAPGYRAEVITSPEAQISSLQVPVTGGWREVLTNAFRGTRPYAGIGGWGTTDVAGEAATVSVAKRRLTMTGIPVGDEPITIDWTFTFNAYSFDMSSTWHVMGELSAGTYEVAWVANSVLPTVGDPDEMDRDGDVAGFPRWTLATDGQVSLAAAYCGAAWSETNHWFRRGTGSFTWQPLWAPGGTTWAAGNYAGGKWRLGVSPLGTDWVFAELLYYGCSN